MPRNGRSARQPSNAPKKFQTHNVPSTLAMRETVAPVPNDQVNQPLRRFAGSVVWGNLPSHPNKSSNLNISTNGKPGVVDELLEDDESWAAQAIDSQSVVRAEVQNQNELTAAMTRLTVQSDAKTESTVHEWRRDNERSASPDSSHCRATSIFPGREKQRFALNAAASRGGTVFMQDANYPRGQYNQPFKGATSAMSCTYQRTSKQPRMNDARPNDYRPFFKHEFVLGTILRGIIHKQDIMGTPDPAMSQVPTNFTNAKSRYQNQTAPSNAGNRHIGHGDWGPIYSENRFLIVVHNRPGDHYYAVPVYSHKGNGLAKKIHKNEYVSVADGRYPYNVEQQSEHRPITALLKNGVDELLPMSAAYASYAVPRKYGLPVAHQGTLDEESTKRLVSMYHEWTDRNGSDGI